VPDDAAPLLDHAKDPRRPSVVVVGWPSDDGRFAVAGEAHGDALESDKLGVASPLGCAVLASAACRIYTE